MGAMKSFLVYLSTGASMLIIDFVWLGIMNSRFYKPHLSTWLSDKTNLWPAMLFYLLFTVGLVVIVIFPSVERGDWWRATLLGGLFGLVAYATYDLTNLALINHWPLVVSVVDIAWGTALSAAVATIGYLVARALG
jgi:uncharacterized membrane protein